MLSSIHTAVRLYSMLDGLLILISFLLSFHTIKGSVNSMCPRIGRFLLSHGASGRYNQSPRDSVSFQESKEQKEKDSTYHRGRGGHGPQRDIRYWFTGPVGPRGPRYDVGPTSGHWAARLYVAIPTTLRERCDITNWGTYLHLHLWRMFVQVANTSYLSLDFVVLKILPILIH